MFPFLRQKNMFDQYGQLDNSPDGSTGQDINDYLPSFQFNDPTLDQPVPGQSPQNPFPAQLFRQSLESDTPDAPDEPFTSKTDWGKRYRDLYQPKTEAETRLNELLNQFPQEEKPSLARKLTAMAAGVGGGGIKGEQAILGEPSANALARWKAQVDPFLTAANNERQGNVNENAIAKQIIAAEQRQEQLDETGRKNKATEDIARKKNEATAKAADQRNELLRAKQSGYTFKVVGNHYIATAPDGSSFDTGYDATNHTPIQVAEITGQYRVAAANAAVGGANARAGTLIRWVDENGNVQTGYANPTTNQATPTTVQGGKPVGESTKVGAQVKGQPANLEEIQKRASETISAINELIDDKDKLRPEIKDVLGVNRYNPAVSLNLPGFSYVTANKTIERVKSMQILDLIGELKNQSRTGATGFGQLSGPELRILETAASKLDTAMDPKDFEKEVIRIRDYVKKIILPPTGLNPTKVPKVMTPQDYFNKYKGEQ